MIMLEINLNLQRKVSMRLKKRMFIMRQTNNTFLKNQLKKKKRKNLVLLLNE